MGSWSRRTRPPATKQGGSKSALKRDAKQRPPAPTCALSLHLPLVLQARSSGYLASLRLCAVAIAAPSSSAVRAWQRPSRRGGETRVASQHKALPMRVAPYNTRSRRRRSPSATPGAEVFASIAAGQPGLQAPGPRARPAPKPAPAKGRGV